MRQNADYAQVIMEAGQQRCVVPSGEIASSCQFTRERIKQLHPEKVQNHFVGGLQLARDFNVAPEIGGLLW